MSNEPSPIDQTTVSHEDVVVTRRLVKKDGGLVGTLELQPTGQNPVVLVHVVDEFPASLPVDTVGFKPNCGPEAGSITPQQATVKQTIETEPIQLEYGIALSDPVETVQFDPPSIREVETASMTRSTASSTNGSEQPRALPDGTDASSGSFASTPPGIGPESASEKGQDGQQSSETKPEDLVVEPTETDASDIDDASNTAIEQAIRRVEGSFDTEGVATETEDDSVESQQSDWVSPTTDTGETGGESPAPARLESSAEADNTAEDPHGGMEQMERRSVEVRLDRLTARVEEFATYAAALEELIDEHGTAPEFIDRTARDLAALEGRIESISQTVEAVRDTHDEDVDAIQEQTDALDQRIDSARDEIETEIYLTRDRVGQVSNEVERIDTELADQGAAVGSLNDDVDVLDERVTGVEDGLEDVRTTVQSVEEDSAAADDIRVMREELESLWTTVEELNDFKESLAHAFDGPAGGTASSDD